MAIRSRNLSQGIESLLRRCNQVRDLEEAKRIHGWIAEIGQDSDSRRTYAANMIVHMYGKCGSVQDAWKVFCSTQQRNVFSWNMIIAAFAQNGHPHRAVELFWEMVMQERLVPSRVTFINVLKDLNHSVEDGRRIHRHAAGMGLGSDLLVATALLHMYGKCGRAEEAKRVFDSMPKRDVVAWTAMITAYAHNGHFEEALELYAGMDPDGVLPNMYTFSIVLDVCCQLGLLQQGIAIHERIVACELESAPVVCNSLINMYGSCKRVDQAERLFNRMQNRSSVSWNSMIAAYAHNGHPEQAIRLYRKMRDSHCSMINAVTIVNVLGACANSGDISSGRSIHRDAAAVGLDSHLVVSSALVTMYGKCGSVGEARTVFEKTEMKDAVAWNAIIAANAQNGHSQEAVLLYRFMCCNSIKPTEATFISLLEACSSLQLGKTIHQHIIDSGMDGSTMICTALLNMYSKCGSLENAADAFHSLVCKNDVSWMNMITAYARHGSIRSASELLREMLLQGGKPNDSLFISILHACSHSGMLEQGISHFVSMVEDHGIVARAEHYGCVVDLLGRSGHLAMAQELVETMPFEPDALDWSSFVSSCKLYSDHNRGQAAAQHVLHLEPARSASYVSLSGLLNV